MNWSLAFEPFFAWPILAAMFALALVFGIAGILLRQRGAWLRLAAFAALALALFNPVLLDEDREPLKSVVALVVDRSQSQDIGERAKQTNDALAGLQERLARFKQFDVRVVEAGKSGAADERTETRLFGALDSAFRDVPPSRIGGAIMITDGQVHDVPAGATAIGAPIHSLITGEEGERDRRIRFEKAPRFGIVGKPLDLTYRVLATGDDRGAVDVRVSINGEQRSIQRAFIGQETPLQIVVPNAGRNIVELQIDRVDGELTDTNNRAIALVDGIRENLRVLLVSGEPHAGERTWRNLLKSDASVDLVHFTILRPPEKQDGTPINELSLIAFPTRELFVEKINEFDLIIFDRYPQRGILPSEYLDNIRDYVLGGGAVLVAAGPDFASVESLYYSGLGEVLPASPTTRVIEGPFLPQISEIGARHPVTQGLEQISRQARSSIDKSGSPWGRWLRYVEVDQPKGEVVMEGPDKRPLLILNREGEGRVALLASDQAWLWSRGFEGGGPQQELLRRLAHWLMKEPQLEEEALMADVNGSDVTVTRRTMTDRPHSVTVTAPDGTTTSLTLPKVQPGLYRSTMKVQEMGLYRLKEGDLERVFVVGPSAPREFENAVATAELLGPIAAATNGGVLRLEAGVPSIRQVREGRPAFGRGWLGITPREAYRTIDLRLTPIMPAWAVLAAILARLLLVVVIEPLIN